MPPTPIDSIARMRIALVSPYSWTFPGGVTRHIDALAREFLAEGHHVKVFSPVDPDDRLTRALHRRSPDPAALPDYVVPLGRTFSLPMNGAQSRLAYNTDSVIRLRNGLRAGDFDVIHVHEPIAPVVGWDACTFDAGAPVVGTFHAYSSSWIPNTIARAIGARRVLNRLTARIAVSEAARWTGERYFGGTYDVIPNGVHTSCRPAAPKPAGGRAAHPLRRSRGGAQGPACSALRLRRPAPAHPGAPADHRRGGRRRRAAARTGRRRHGRHRRPGPRRRRRAVAATARSGRAVCTFAGRRELWNGADRGVCRRHSGHRVGHRGLPPGRHARPRRPAHDAWRPARACRGAALGVARPGAPRRRWAVAARKRADDFAWPQVARRVASVYERAVAAPAPVGAAQTARVKAGLVQRDLTPSPRARRLRSIEPAPPRAPRGARALAGLRRAALATVRDRRCPARVPRAAPRRFRQRRDDASALEPDLGADRARAVLHLDVPASGVVVPHRASGAARPAGEATHDPERHVHRGADVRDAPRATR